MANRHNPKWSGLRLPHKDALTLLWGQNVYRDRYALEYIKHLDLSEGQDLVQSCNVICPWYSEIIINRKFYIRKLLEHFYKKTKREFQLVTISPGHDPLSLEAAGKYSDKITNIIEVDPKDHSGKKYVMEEVAPDLVKKINFLQADIFDPDFMKVMEADARYDLDKPAFVIAEGVSYFLSKSELEFMFFEFSSVNRHNMFVMDYMLSDDQIGKTYRNIPGQIFETLMEYISDRDGGFEYLSLNHEEVEKLYEACGCMTSCFYPQSIMEHCRKGIYAYFHPDNDGWVALSAGKI